MAEPLKVIAGDTWTWTRSMTDYPASDGWALTYFLAKSDEKPRQISADVDGSGFKVTVPATDTVEWDPGTYRWTARVTKASEVYTVEIGTFTVDPDPSAAVDRRTHAEKALAAIEAALAASAGDLIVEYEIDGVKAKKDRSAVERERDKLRIEVAIQRRRPILSRITLGGVR